MSEEQTTLLLLMGALAGMDRADQEQVKSCADKLRSVIAEHGDNGILALGLVGAELAAQV